ncbi:MAG: class I SAM-dependent methyltransferase [Pseudomonadota bacterium]
MTTLTVYDEHADFYVGFIDGVRDTPAFQVSIDAIFEELGNVRDLNVCDLACGEGFLSRLLAQRGARVHGYDASRELVETARQRSGDAIQFEVGDAQHLPGVEDDRFDIVICHMAIMDIPDIDALFRTVRRVLRSGGRFFLTVLHPCFETPFDDSTGGLVEQDENQNFVACRVMRYTDEGLWHSGGTGVRGHMGAFHRMLSTYINSLTAAGHQITKLLEPMLPTNHYEDLNDQWAMKIPRRLTICTSV